MYDFQMLNNYFSKQLRHTSVAHTLLFLNCSNCILQTGSAMLGSQGNQLECPLAQELVSVHMRVKPVSVDPA